MKRKFVYVDTPHDVDLDKAMIWVAEQSGLPPSHPDVKRLAELGLHVWPDGVEQVQEIVGNLDDVRNWGATKIGWHVEVDVSGEKWTDLRQLAMEHPKSISIHDTKQHEWTDDDRCVLEMMGWCKMAVGKHGRNDFSKDAESSPSSVEPRKRKKVRTLRVRIPVVERLKDAKFLSDAKLAELMKCNVNTVRGALKGKNLFLSTIVEMARALDVEPDEIADMPRLTVSEELGGLVRQPEDERGADEND